MWLAWVLQKAPELMKRYKWLWELFEDCVEYAKSNKIDVTPKQIANYLINLRRKR